MKVPCVIQDPNDPLRIAVDEIDTEEQPLAPYYIRALHTPPMQRTNESRMPMDKMKLETIAFRLDKSRTCWTKVYVSENCLPHLKNRDGYEEILKIMIERLFPWLFTYGERAIQKLP